MILVWFERSPFLKFARIIVITNFKTNYFFLTHTHTHTCEAFPSPRSRVLRRDVGASCVRSVAACSASEYYCHCAMSVSFPRICNEIFAVAAAGLCATAQSEPHCSNTVVSPRTLPLVIYTASTFSGASRTSARAFATVDRTAHAS